MAVVRLSLCESVSDLITIIVSAVIGGSITKLTELWVESVNRRNAARATPTLAKLDDVLRWGWDGKALLRRLIALDQRVVGGELTETGEKLTEEREGTVKQWAPVFMAHPESWVLLTVGPKQIIGYWDIAALRDEHFKRAKAGELLDSEITLDTVEPLDLPGVYNLYFVLLGVLPEYPGAGAKLIDAFYDHLEALATRGVFFREVCANAFTKHGKRICTGLGMTFVGPHKDFGEVYCLPLYPWPKRLRHKRWQELSQLYERALNENPRNT